MNAKQKIHLARLQEWTARCSDQKSSGLTVREWCEANSISIHAFNYWKHQLKEEAADQLLPDIVPLSLTSANTPDNTMTAVQSTSLTSGHTLRANCTNRADQPMVRFAVNGTLVEVDPAVPESFLLTLVRAVRHA